MKPKTFLDLEIDKLRALKAIQAENSADNPAEPPTTGVFSIHDLEHLDDLDYNSVNITFEEHCQDVCEDTPETCYDCWYEADDRDVYLVGHVWNETDKTYEPDPNAEYRRRQ
jgi:hypothetical protein